MRLKLMLLVCMLPLVLHIVTAKDITLSLNQSEYYFLVNQNSMIPLAIDNEFEKDVTGMLTYTVEQQIMQQGFQYSSSNTQSQTFTIPGNEEMISISFGTSEQPVTLTVSLNFKYTEEDEKVVTLDPFKIHFVQDSSQQQNNNQQMESSSETTEEKREQAQQEKEEQEQLAQQQAENQRKLQNNLQNTDMNQVKNQMQKDIQQKNKEEQDLKKFLEQNQDVGKKHQEMLDQGYQQKDLSMNSESNETGDFEITYEKNGTTEQIKGRVENGSIKDMLNTKEMKEALQQNKEYQELTKELAQKGFTPQEFQVQSQESFRQTFTDQYNNTVEVSHDKGNLSEAHDFEVTETVSDSYIIQELLKDEKFQKIREKLTAKNYSYQFLVDKDGDASSIDFVHGNKTEKVYFTEPRLIQGETNVIRFITDTIKLGYKYIFGRT